MIRLGAGILLLSMLGAVSVVVAGATALSIRPDVPRDRAAPSIRHSGGPVRIAVLGTSLSSSSRYQWPDVVGKEVSGRIGRPVEVSRVTQPGATSSWGARQTRRIIEMDPDVVLIELAVNDADIRHAMTTRASVARHTQLIDELQTGRPTATIIMLTMNPASGPRGWVRPFLSRYYGEYAALAAHHDVGLVDLYARWLALPSGQRELSDGLHPSDAAATSVIVGPLVEELTAAAQRSG